MVAIYGDKKPHMLLHELRSGGAQEAADALATWAWGSLALTATHPASIPGGEIDIAISGGRRTAMYLAYSSTPTRKVRTIRRSLGYENMYSVTAAIG